MLENKKISKILVMSAIVVFLLGLFFYFFYYLESGDLFFEISIAILKSIFSSARLFLGDSDYNTIENQVVVHDFIRTDVFEIIFWLIHLLAAGISVSTLLYVFGSQVKYWLKRFKLKKCNEIFLIFGVNKDSLIFCENIQKKHRRIEMIDYFISDEVEERLKKIGCYLTKTGNLANGKVLKEILTKIKNIEGKKIMAFAFTEDDAININIALDILISVKEMGIPKENFRLSIKAENELLHEILEDFQKEKDKYEVQTFSKSKLSVAQLFSLENSNPYNLVEFDKNGNLISLKRNFKVLIIGFGDTGQQAFKKLIYNSQFEGLQFEAIIVDKKMNEIIGQFKNNYPGIFDHYKVKVYPYHSKSEEYFEMLKKEIKDVDYAVVALYDDNVSLDTATNLIEVFKKVDFGKNRKRIIAVNIRNSDHVFQVFEESKNLKIKLGYLCFGQYEKIFTEDFLVNEKLDSLAKVFNKTYSGKSAVDWNCLNIFTRNSNRANAEFIPAVFKIMGLEIVAKTDKRMSVTRDEYEKMIAELEENDQILSRTEHQRWNAFHFANGWNVMPKNRIVKRNGMHKDVLLKTHACLISWEELPEIDKIKKSILEEESDFRKNDIMVAKTSFLAIEEMGNLKIVRKENEKI